MLKKMLLVSIILIIMLSLFGCQTFDGVGRAVQGMGRDISWLSKQRMAYYNSEDQIYYSEIGGEKAYYQKVDDSYVRLAMR